MRLAFVGAAILLMAVTIEGQQDRTPFRVGIAVNSEDTTATDECTESEQAFLQSKLEAYIVSLGRLFFDDESLTLTEPLKEISDSHFSDLAFSDFNAYEAWKYDRATGNVINLNQLDALNVTITTADPIALPSDKNSISTTSSPASTPSPNTPMPTGPLPTPSVTNIMSSKPTSSPAMSPTVSPTASPTPVCSTVETCSTINFDTLPNGTRLSRGAYVSDEWNATYGLTITVKPTSTSGGYAPIKAGTNLTQGRIFDTSNPVSSWYGGNVALGSPNTKCVGGGPGSGSGGEPGKAGENCAKLGNVLIIQKSNQYTPESASVGGSFKLRFASPVKFQSLGLLDISGYYTMGNVTVTKSDGSTSTFKYKALGPNSIQTVDIALENVVKVMVYISESAAIAFLNFCSSSCSVIKKRQLLRLPDDTHAVPVQNSAIATTQAINEDTNQHRKLVTILFRWGGTSSMRCMGCPADAKDARRLNVRNRQLQGGTMTSFLISAFETTITFGLTLNMIWDYKAWLKSQNLSAGCLGGGNKLRVVFELDLTAPVKGI